jgi:hypothetical protein
MPTAHDPDRVVIRRISPVTTAECVVAAQVGNLLRGKGGCKDRVVLPMPNR